MYLYRVSLISIALAINSAADAQSITISETRANCIKQVTGLDPYLNGRLRNYPQVHEQAIFACVQKAEANLKPTPSQAIEPKRPINQSATNKPNIEASENITVRLVQNNSNTNSAALNGITLGEKLSEELFASFNCNPSDSYRDLLFCTKNSASSATSTSTTLLITGDRKTAYIGFSLNIRAPTTRLDELNKIVRQLGPPESTVSFSQSNGSLEALLARWGRLSMSEVKGNTLQNIKDGKPSGLGILFDFIGNYKSSADENAPIFSFDHGLGIVWRIFLNSRGQGNVRIVAIDATTLNTALQPLNAYNLAAKSEPQISTTDQLRLERALKDAERSKLEAEKLKAEAEQLKLRAEALLKDEELNRRKKENEEAEANAIKYQKKMSIALQMLSTPQYIDLIYNCEAGSYSKHRISGATSLKERSEIRTSIPKECRCLAFEAALEEQDNSDNFKRFDTVFKNDIDSMTSKYLSGVVDMCIKRNITDLIEKK